MDWRKLAFMCRLHRVRILQDSACMIIQDINPRNQSKCVSKGQLPPSSLSIISFILTTRPSTNVAIVDIIGASLLPIPDSMSIHFTHQLSIHPFFFNTYGPLVSLSAFLLGCHALNIYATLIKLTRIKLFTPIHLLNIIYSIGRKYLREGG